ncbi:MAG: DUF6636 domain-containing protein [Aestuariivirga sp.]
MRLTFPLRFIITSLVLSAASMTAQADGFNFKTPSGNIFCGYDDFDGTPQLRCDIQNYTPTAEPRPADCELDWGGAFGITADGTSGIMICHGDTVATPDAKTLPYDATWERGGISCSSAQTGLTCRNAAGYGFFLSRAKQEVF